MSNYKVAPGKDLIFQLVLEPPVVQRLHWIFEARQVTPGRIYQMFLLLSKIVFFLSQRTSQQVDSLPVWSLLEQICHESDKQETKRKRANALGPPSFNMLTSTDIG